MLLADAPVEILARVLQHVPLRQRMSNCALVQRSWYHAAAAATTEVSCTKLSPAAASSLAAQLNSSSWAQHITSLELGRSKRHSQPKTMPCFWVPQLSCPNLQQLDLSYMDLDLFCNGVSVLEGCPALQSLRLQFCTLVDEPEPTLSALSAVTGLTKLHVENLNTLVAEGKGKITQYLADLEPLRNLTALQELHITETDGGDTIEKLFGKEDEQDAAVALSQQGQQKDEDTPMLLPSLIRLVIDCGQVEYYNTNTPLLPKISSLKSLELRDAPLIWQLGDFTQIERLKLHSRYSDAAGEIDGYDHDFFKPPQTCFHEEDYRWGPGDGDTRGTHYPVCAIWPRDLLDALPKLARLRHLDVSGLSEHEPGERRDWSALRCATNLETLRLQYVFIRISEWPQLFGGAHLPQLRELLISGDPAHERQAAPMPAQCLQDIVTACPNLAALELFGHGLLDKVPLKPVSELTGLTRLRVICENSKSRRKEQAVVLAKLQQLRHLHVEGLQDMQLLQLTVLNKLTYFRRDLSCCGGWDDDEELSEVECWEDVGRDPPFVWQQLLEHCRHNRQCALLIKHRETVERLQRTIDKKQQHIRQQQRQLQQQQCALRDTEQMLQEHEQLLQQKDQQLYNQQQQLQQQQQQLQDLEQQRYALQQQVQQLQQQLADKDTQLAEQPPAPAGLLQILQQVASQILPPRQQ